MCLNLPLPAIPSGEISQTPGLTGASETLSPAPVHVPQALDGAHGWRSQESSAGLERSPGGETGFAQVQEPRVYEQHCGRGQQSQQRQQPRGEAAQRAQIRLKAPGEEAWTWKWQP